MNSIPSTESVTVAYRGTFNYLTMFYQNYATKYRLSDTQSVRQKVLRYKFSKYNITKNNKYIILHFK